MPAGDADPPAERGVVGFPVRVRVHKRERVSERCVCMAQHKNYKPGVRGEYQDRGLEIVVLSFDTKLRGVANGLLPGSGPLSSLHPPATALRRASRVG